MNFDIFICINNLEVIDNWAFIENQASFSCDIEKRLGKETMVSVDFILREIEIAAHPNCVCKFKVDCIFKDIIEIVLLVGIYNRIGEINTQFICRMIWILIWTYFPIGFTTFSNCYRRKFKLLWCKFSLEDKVVIFWRAQPRLKIKSSKSFMKFGIDAPPLLYSTRLERNISRTKGFPVLIELNSKDKVEHPLISEIKAIQSNSEYKGRRTIIRLKGWILAQLHFGGVVDNILA
jgi:hypothetical protein